MSTPELDKLAAVANDSQVIGDFLEWLDTHGRFVGQWYDERAAPAAIGTEALLAEYFGIDLKRVERERRAILEAVRRGSPV